jgi:hypothetical protein
MRDWDAEFAAIAENPQKFFPGSNKPIVRDHARAKEKRAELPDVESWDAHPRMVMLGGQTVEMFTVGDLAKAIGREAGTIRKWERDGIIPRNTYRLPSSDPRGVRRLYSRKQIEGIVRITREEGLDDAHRRRNIKQTNFTQRVIDLFRELARN